MPLLHLPAIAVLLAATSTAQPPRPTFLQPAPLGLPISGPVAHPSLDLTGGQLVVAQGASGARDLTLLARPDLVSPFAVTADLASANTSYDESGATLAAYGDAVYFASDRPGGPGSYDLYIVRRFADQGAFGAPQQVANVNAAAADSDPWVSADALTLLFASKRPGTLGGYSIWVATRGARQSPWSVPAPIAELDSARDERWPELSQDGLTVWFSSNRLGGAGGFDLYWAQRPSAGLPFGTPQPVAELNSVNDETRLHVPFFSRSAYLTIGPAGPGGDQIATADLDAALLFHSGDPGLGEPHMVFLGGAPSDLAAIAFSAASGPPITLPGVQGSLTLDPTTLFVVSSGSLDNHGYSYILWTVPQDPNLVGIPLHFQGLVVSLARGRNWFSNAVAATIVTASLSATCGSTFKSCVGGCVGSIPSGLITCAVAKLYKLIFGGWSSYAGSVAVCVGISAGSCFLDCLVDWFDCKF